MGELSCYWLWDRGLGKALLSQSPQGRLRLLHAGRQAFPVLDVKGDSVGGRAEAEAWEGPTPVHPLVAFPTSRLSSDVTFSDSR